MQKLLIPIKFQIQTNDNPSKSRHTNLPHVLGLFVLGVAACLVYLLCCVTCADVILDVFAGAHTVSVNSSPQTGTDFERTVVKGARFSLLANKIREPGCFKKWLPQLCSVNGGVHILSRLAQLMIITRFNSEIIPTRCNNCVYSSQWLYSTCFGRQFHPSSGVQCCIWPLR